MDLDQTMQLKYMLQAWHRCCCAAVDVLHDYRKHQPCAALCRLLLALGLLSHTTNIS